MREHLEEIGAKIFDLETMSQALMILGEDAKDNDHKRLLFFVSASMGYIHKDLSRVFEKAWAEQSLEVVTAGKVS